MTEPEPDQCRYVLMFLFLHHVSQKLSHQHPADTVQPTNCFVMIDIKILLSFQFYWETKYKISIKYFCKIVAWHSTLCWRLKMFCCWDLDPTQYLWLLKQQIFYPIQDERRNYGPIVNQTWTILSVNLNVSCVDIDGNFTCYVVYEYDKVW